VLTLAPLGALVVVFGLFPGLVLEIVEPSVETVLDDVSKAAAIDVPTIVPVAVLAIVGAVVVARILAALNRPTEERALVATGGGGR
jgi:hypothetical protein